MKSNRLFRSWHKGAAVILLVVWAAASGCATQKGAASSLGKRVTQTQEYWRPSAVNYVPAQLPQNQASLAAQTEQMLGKLVAVSPLRGYPVKVMIANNRNLNASADGLTVVMNSGLLLMFGRDPNVVASVMAHELGHILAGHKPQSTKTSPYGMLRYATPLLSFVPYGSYAGLAVNEGSSLQVAKYSRVQENEADVIGAYLTASADYDPRALGWFLELAAKCGCKGSGLPSGISIPTSLSSIPQSVAVPLLRTSPLYRSHPDVEGRKRTIDLVARRKAGQMTDKELKKEASWIAAIYDTLEKRCPKDRG
ncbi:MAG: M48 family metallopeptidase [Candidatus Omnitrophota bacterium]|jgi:predicted Zn-dependent protease